MAKKTAIAGALACAGSAALALASTGAGLAKSSIARTGVNCPGDAGLSLPPGFCATVFADNLGHARHLVVAKDGTVYVNTWRMHKDAPVPAGGFLVALRD